MRQLRLFLFIALQLAFTVQLAQAQTAPLPTALQAMLSVEKLDGMTASEWFLAKFTKSVQTAYEARCLEPENTNDFYKKIASRAMRFNLYETLELLLTDVAIIPEAVFAANYNQAVARIADAGVLACQSMSSRHL